MLGSLVPLLSAGAFAALQAPVTVVANAPGGAFRVTLTDASGPHPCPREVTFVDPCRLTLAIGSAALTATGTTNLQLHFELPRQGRTLVLHRYLTSVSGILATGMDIISVFILLPAVSLGCGIPAATSGNEGRRNTLLLGCLLPGVVLTAAAAVVPWFTGPLPVWDACVAGTEGCSREFPTPPFLTTQ
jgi:hypothetical protein